MPTKKVNRKEAVAPRARRKCKVSRDTERELAGLNPTGKQRADFDSLRATLALWAFYVMELSPTFASDLFGVIHTEWIAGLRGGLYEEYSNDPRDACIVNFNVSMLRSLARLRGEGKYEGETKHLAAFQEKARELLAQMHKVNDLPIPAATKPPAKPVTETITLSDESWKAADLTPFKLAPGDKLELELITDEPRAGETIALKKKKEDHYVTFGRFDEVCDNEEGVETVWIFDNLEKMCGFERAAYNLWRIRFVTHRGAYSDEQNSEQKADRERKLNALRRRLERLERGDDITDSSARFKLEKQIYDLEHEPADTWEGFDEVKM